MTLTYRPLLAVLLSTTLIACGGGSSGSSDTESDSMTDGMTDEMTDGMTDNMTDSMTDGMTDEMTDTGDSMTNTGNTVTGNVTYFGFIDLDEEAQIGGTETEVEASAGFIQFSSMLDSSQLNSLLAPQTDTCTVENVDISSIPDDLPDFNFNVSSSNISAGEVLPMTSAAGSYLELQRISFAGFDTYQSVPESVPGPIPSGVVINIPGGPFPAFSNVAMPTVETLNILTPTAGEVVTPSTQFTWTAGSNPNASISIGMSSLGASGLSTIVDCIAADDGAFTIPAATQAAMGSAFTSVFTDYYREEVRVVQQGNAVLILTASSGR